MNAAAPSDAALVDKSLPEHAEMKRLMERLRGMQTGDPLYDDSVMELMRGVLHHVADEETRLLPDAERALGDKLKDLGADMAKRRLELAIPRASEIARDAIRAFPAMSLFVAVFAGIAGGYMVKRATDRP